MLFICTHVNSGRQMVKALSRPRGQSRNKKRPTFSITAKNQGVFTPYVYVWRLQLMPIGHVGPTSATCNSLCAPCLSYVGGSTNASQRLILIHRLNSAVSLTTSPNTDYSSHERCTFSAPAIIASRATATPH